MHRPILIIILLTFVMLPLKSFGVMKDLEKYQASMNLKFSTGVKPNETSLFIGIWEKGWKYTFLKDGTIIIDQGDNKIVTGKWVLLKRTEKDIPYAMYKVGDYSTELWIRDNQLMVSAGDTWSIVPRKINTSSIDNNTPTKSANKRRSS